MLPVAQTKHHIQGRLRLRITTGRRDPALLERIGQSLSAAAGVRRTQVNLTASAIVIEYDPAMYHEFPHALAGFADREGLFHMEPPRDDEFDGGRSVADQALDQVFGHVNRAVQNATGDLVNLKELLPLGVVASALLFVDRAAVAAQWLSWIQFAWSSYWDLHQDEPVQRVGRDVKALRAEVAAVRELLEQSIAPRP